VKELSQGKILLKDGSLYPALQKMTSDGLLSFKEETVGGRVRKEGVDSYVEARAGVVLEPPSQLFRGGMRRKDDRPAPDVGDAALAAEIAHHAAKGAQVGDAQEAGDARCDHWGLGRRKYSATCARTRSKSSQPPAAADEAL